MNLEYSVLIIAFALIALIYASVGFGGGSSYLAILSLSVFALPFPVIRSTALLCNIVVVTGGTIIFYKEGKLSFRELWPYLVSSTLMAYIGGKLKISEHTFFLLLAFTLITVAFLLWLRPERFQREGSHVIPESIPLKLLMGGAIGFLSGLVGIGGGIFLSPLLHILNWSEPKRISALASAFILLNSISGLVGQFSNGIPGISISFLLPLLLAVMIGGQVGSRLGARTFKPLYIKRITAVLTLVAGLNILKDHL